MRVYQGRVLGLPQRHFASPTALKLAVLGGVLVLLGLLAFFADRSPNLAHLRGSILSASERGNYYAIVNALAAEARQQKGHIANVASAGSVENLAQLVASQTTCHVHFALVQDGIPWPAGSSLELIGRLSKAESLVFLGWDADRIKSLQDLRGMRIGIGPMGSGTAHVVRQVLASLAALDLTLSTQRLDEQLVQLERGELDLGAMVIDEDAQRLVEAVRDRQLQILNLPHADVLARWLQLILGFTLLNNAMAGWHQFRLWRIDAKRVRIESALLHLFNPGVTVGEIAEMPPRDQHHTSEVRAQLDTIMEQLVTLSERCRQQSLSMLVPMGQEMAYRYQDALMADLLYALRTFRERLGP
jgi:NMT1 family protein